MGATNAVLASMFLCFALSVEPSSGFAPAARTPPAPPRALPAALPPGGTNPLAGSKKPMSEWTEEEKLADKERGELLLKVKGAALAVGLLAYFVLQQ